MPEKINKLAVGILFLVFLFALGFAIIKSVLIPPTVLPPSQPPSSLSKIEGIKKFASEEDFKTYLEESQLGYLGGMGIGAARMPLVEEGVPAPTPLEMPLEAKGAVPERVSATTVQVLGIDEPDIVKTDGKEIYFSQSPYIYPIFWRELEEKIIPPQKTGETKIIGAFPPEDLKIDSKIEERGDLLLAKDILVIFSEDKIFGYDISNPQSPNKKWEVKLEDNNFLVGARLYQNKIYLVNKTQIDSYHPCPIKPLSIEGTPLEIKCVDIYHPIVQTPIDVTYSAMVLNPDSGKIEKTVSFVGSSEQSVIYMSKGAIYVTYSYFESAIKFFTNFLKEKGQDLVPAWLIEKLEKLESYEISDQAKYTEFTILLQRYYNSLSNDERLRIENEMENRMSDYFKEHKRELEKTGIIKIGLAKFEISATGNIPGRPLNQFSLDEYNDNLRVATTVGEGFWGFGGQRESSNDVYVLDENLKILGSVQDLGLTERIYSARFIEDKGYLVTFRQIDPFFVLDLSDPKNPQLKGELKIPGYSSYLHPITKDKILGIGKEGWQVKISLFDVSDPEKPTEISKYNLDESWSDILNTHHAFLLDSKHQIFFLPGGRGGYVFSHKDNKLELKRAVSDISAKRAIYINDYLYIIGENKIVVLNELNWEKINELEF
jgi:uncharacterized secreted protein with C-terminal beta-propeller domain